MKTPITIPRPSTPADGVVVEEGFKILLTFEELRRKGLTNSTGEEALF